MIVPVLFVLLGAGIPLKANGRAGFGVGQLKNVLLEHEKNKLRLRMVEKNKMVPVEIAFTDVHNADPWRKSLVWRGLAGGAPRPETPGLSEFYLNFRLLCCREQNGSAGNSGP